MAWWVLLSRLQDNVNGPCRTDLRLVGSDGWSPTSVIGLIQRVSGHADVLPCLIQTVSL